MAPKFREPNFKGKNKLFRHEVHNIRLGVGYTVIGKHTIRLLVDRLTAEEERKIADHTQANAESIMHMEICDLALTYGNREFLMLKRALEPLCLTTKITLHYYQRIAKILLQAFADHIECDSYFALLNLTMALARDIGKLFIPFFDLFSRALMRGLYDKETGSMFIAKTDRVQLTFTALSALVIGIGGIVSTGLSSTAVASGTTRYTNEDEDDMGATYERSFMPSIPSASELNDEQNTLLSSMRRVVALVVQRTFRDTKEYIRRLGAEVIAALCRRHARLLPLALSVCTQAVGVEVRAARAGTNKRASSEDDEDNSGDDANQEDEDGEEEEKEENGGENEGDGDAAEELDDDEDAAKKALTEEEINRPILPEDLQSSAIADSMLFLTRNLLIGIKGALTTNFESSIASILNALIHQSLASEENNSALCPQSLHSIATHVVCGTFAGVITAIRNDQTNTSIPRILNSLVEQLLPNALRHLEGELHAAAHRHVGDPSSSSSSSVAAVGSSSSSPTASAVVSEVHAPVAYGYAVRYLRVALSAVSAANQIVLNRAGDNEDTTAAVKTTTEGLLAILRSARGFIKPKTGLPPNLPLLFADALTVAQCLLLTDVYSSPDAMKLGETFVAAILAESGRMLQAAMTTNDKTLILAVVNTLKDFFQDVSQKSVAHASRFGQRTDADGGLSMPCLDEFIVAVFVVLTAKVANGQLESGFRRDFVDSLMVMAEIAQSTLISASASGAHANFPHMLSKIVNARIPPAPNAEVAKPAKSAKGGKQASTSAVQDTPRLISTVFVGWMNEDIAAVLSEISNGTFASNEEHFLGQVARVSVWLSLMPAIDQKAVGCFEECVGAAGDLLAAGGQKASKVYLSAKLRTRLLQLYVRGSAALSRQTGDTVGQSNATAASKLSAIIHQIAASIPKGFHAEDSNAQKKQRQPTKPATGSDAEANNTTISLLLAAFDRLRTSTAVNNNSSSDSANDGTSTANDTDASLWIDQCIAPEAYSDFVFVLMHSLATTKSPSTRLSTLVLLKDCYTYQHRVALSSSDPQSSASLPPFAMASLALRKSQSGGSVAQTMAQSVLTTDLGVFDLLIRCEKVDPLSEGLDAKANVLAPIVFDAANTTNFFERYYGRSDAFMIQTLVRYCFGAINVKFAPMWTIAVRIIGNMLRQELVKKADNALSLWTRLAQPLIVAAVLGNREGSTHHALSNAETDFSEDVAPVTAVLTQGLYRLSFDESQLHASGALVSKAFRQISAESVRARQVHKLNGGQRLTLSDVAFGAEQSSGEHALSQSTDSATVTRVLLNALMTLSDHIHHSREVHADDTKKGTAAAISVLSFPEQLVLRLAESDVGATFDSEDEDSLGLIAMPSTSNAKALSQRLEMSILSMSAQYSLNSQALANAGVAPSRIARRKEVLEAALLQYVCSSDSRLQAASVEGLRKMGVAPYSKYSDFLFPICGGRLTIADFTTNKNKSGNNKKGTSGVDSAPKRLGTNNAKSALTFLQSFNLEASINEEDRVGYITAMLLLCLPVLTSTGRAGSGGNAHKKVRDREVLGRKVFALLSRVKASDAASTMGTIAAADAKSSKKKNVSGSGKSSQYKLSNEDPLALVVDVLLERILQLPPLDPSAEDPMSRYDLCLNLVSESSKATKGSVTTMTIAKLRRKYEQLTRRVVSAVKLLQALVPAVGTRFLEYSQRCFLLLLHTYEASMPANVVQRAGLEGTVRLPGESGNAIRRNVVGLMRGLLDAYPAAIAEFFLGNAKRTSLFLNTLESIYSHAPLVASSGTNMQVGIRGGTTAPLPPPIEVSLTLSHHVELFPFIAASAEMLLLPAIDRYFRQTASDAVVLAVLDIVGHIVARADERLPAVHMPTDGKLIATTMRKGLLEPHGEAMFSSLHRFVTVTSESVLSEVPLAKKDRPVGSVNPLRVSPKIWKDVILLASALPEYIRGGNASAESLERNMSQLLEIAINFARSPVCATDRASADMAAETIESIIKQVPSIHPTSHFRRLMHLFNNVTAPIARTVLCSALKIAVTKIEGMTDLATMLQLQAVARCVACMNAFSRSDADADEVPAGSKRSRKDEDDNEEDEDNVQQQQQNADDLDALDFSRYDFELRYHAFYSITSFFNKASGEKGAPTTAVGKTNKALATSRKERQYAGEHDVEIPLTVEQPRLTMEAAALLALNFLFFIRDRERTIRTFAGESLHALIKYVSRYPIFTGAEDDAAVDSISSVPAQVDPLNQLIRPVLLPAFRRGIVSKDSSARLEHMQGFGYLAQHLPTYFPSLAMLYSPNSEASFYSCIGSAQHRVRMNALNSLRKKCGQMHQREVLRVFVPFIVTYLKDYAQGKQDARSEQISEAKQKGFADSLLQTLAAISANMPWEGYHRILSLLLREAKDHEALRAVMLKGIVRVLESFHFLETDVTTGERRIASKVEEWSDDDEEGEANEKKDENVVEDPTQDVNDAAAELATSALTPSARAERKNIRIMSILEEEVLPQLYAFILSQKRVPKSKDLEGTLNESNKGMKNQDRKNEPKASVQLPVAVGILKIIRLFPQHRFDHHVDILLNEIVLKLRTKNDKQRETARNVLFAMMNEAGPQKLRFVVTKLRDNLVHGYQLHVLGYTLVGLLHSMFGFAGEKATVVAPQEENEAENEAEDDGDSDSDDEEDGEKKKKGDNEEDGKDDSKDDEKLATTDGKKAPNSKKPATPPKAIMPYTPADEKRIIGKAFRMGGTRRRIFSAEESTAALDAVMNDLFDVFVDDYLGEVGEQKEQTELISTLREVKHNKSLQGFSFLAMYCSGEKVMDMFVTKIRWVLAPPSAKELVKNTSNSAHVMGDNSKYMHGGKRRAADARFVERVRVLAVRVAKALVLNNTLSLGAALTSSLTMLNRNNTLREAKIAEFEAKDGTRRIRGNIDQFTAAKKLTLKEQRDKNYVVEERPDRIDFDFSSHTVLATQHKQKLRVYKGGYAKHLKETSKGFRTEDTESAVVLDTLDEFNLKFLLLLLKKALGIGRAVTKTKQIKIVTEAAAEGEEGAEEDAAAANAEHERELAAATEGGEDDEAGLAGATDAFEEGYDEMELFERQQRHEDELGEGRAVKKNEAKAAKQAKAERTLAELFGAEHKGQLSELLVPVLAILQGEGADSVITTGFEVTHALLAINPPLPAVQTSGQVLFDVIADLFDRGGEVKPRAMRVLSALVQHAYFSISNEQALWITKVARGEVIERSKYVTMGLGLLQAVVNKRVEIVEVYELIDSVTELMMHKASSPPVRNRCVSIIAKFITEYRITMEKLQSHMNMYVQNLQYPNVDGRLAMLELLGVLVFRLPQQVLRQEANVLFIPLVHCMAESLWASCQEKAAVVIQSLVLNAGVDLVAKTITVWLQSETMKTREYAMQVLAVILPILPQLYGADATEEGVAHDPEAKAERFEIVKAATEWAISELQLAIVYDHPLSKNKQQQIKEEIQREVAAKAGKKKSLNGISAEEIALMVSRRIRVEKEMASWSFIFFSLRAVEALTVISPSFASYFAEGENAVIFEHLAKSLVPHSHPWVRSAATRVFNNYLKGYAFAAAPYGDSTVRWVALDEKEKAAPQSHATTGTKAFLVLPTSVHNGVVTVNATIDEVREVQENAKRVCKQLLVVIANSDVRDELHYGYRAIDDPFRTVLVEATSSLARIISITAILLSDTSALASVWSQLQSMIEPILAGRSVRGYLVRSATMIQLLANLVKGLPFASLSASAAEGGSTVSMNLVSSIVDVPQLETIIVPFAGICAESTEISHRVAEFGLATIEVMKTVVGQHGPEFEGVVLASSDAAREGARKSKKRKAEAGSGSILAMAAAEAAYSRSAHAAVALALTKITDEIKERQKKAKLAEMHERNFKKAQRQQESAEKYAAMNQKRTGGKRRSRYA